MDDDAQGDSLEVDRRWVNLLTREIQAAEVTLVAELARADATIEQLLAMKLSAWRDDVDIADARRLLQELASTQRRDDIWAAVQSFLVPGNELKAQYAFADLWESLHGNS